MPLPQITGVQPQLDQAAQTSTWGLWGWSDLWADSSRVSAGDGEWSGPSVPGLWSQLFCCPCVTLSQWLNLSEPQFPQV